MMNTNTVENNPISYNLLSKEHIGEGVRYQGVARVLTAIAGVISTILIIRTLTRQDFAFYAFVLTLQAYIEEISSLGLPHIIQRYIPELRVQKSAAKIKKCIVLCALIGFGASLLVSGGAIFLIRFFPSSGLQKFSISILLSGCILGMINFIFWIFRLSLVALLHFREMSIIWTLSSLSRLCAISIAFFIGGRLFALIGIEIIIILLTSMVVFLITRRKLFSLTSSNPKSEWPHNFFSRSKKYAFVSYSYDIAGLVLSSWTDLMVVAIFLSPGSLASLAFSTKVTRMFMKFTPGKFLESLITSVFINKYVINPSRDNLQRLFNFVLKVQVYFIAHLILTFWILKDVFVGLFFGQKYLTDSTLVLCVLLAEGANVVIYSSGLATRAIEKPSILLKSKIFAVYNILAYLILIKMFGVYGVVLATGSANWLALIYVYIMICKSADLRLPWKEFLYVAASVLVWSFSLLLFCNLIESNILLATSLGFLGALSLLVWFYLSLHVFNYKEKEFFFNIVRINKYKKLSWLLKLKEV